MLNFNSYGLLPKGIHKMPLADFKGLFGFNPKRLDMIEEGLEPVLKELSQFRLPEMCIDGSFVTAAPNPSDIDAYISTRTDKELSAFLGEQQDLWRAKYRVDLYPAFEDLEGESSPDFWNDFFSFSGIPGTRKGLVALQLTNA